MPLFRGISAFPITPADEHGVIDADAVSRLAVRLDTAGVDSIGLLGSTGGYAYLTRGERRRAIRAAVTAVQGQMPIMVGIGALRTDDVVHLARDAAAEGADALLLAPMSYTPLTEGEVYQHYVTAAAATDLPLCVYNNPGTTHFAFTPALIARLAGVPGIAAIKMPLPDATSIAEELRAMRGGPAGRLAIGYSADWGMADALLSGADAFYSVAAGVLPLLVTALGRAASAGDAQAVRRFDAQLQPLWALFREFGSFRVCYASLDALGVCRALPPKPVLPLSGADAAKVRAVIEGLRE
jgi:4-hydroxy-tetrahydrodipicolinate synthase